MSSISNDNNIPLGNQNIHKDIRDSLRRIETILVALAYENDIDIDNGNLND